MSDPLQPEPPLAPKQDPESLVLRGRPRPPIRFRRGLIVGIAGAFAAGLVGLSWFALEPPSLRKAASAFETDGPAPAKVPEALDGAPRNYGDVPRLGPPLPGDLGRPILEHQQSLQGDQGAAELGNRTAQADEERSAAEAERERALAARAAALSSPVMVQLARGSDAQQRIPAGTPAAASGQSAIGTSLQSVASPASQQEKIAFARSGPGNINPHQLGGAPSPWMLSAGTVIPASLVTGLNSDLPGMVIAQVTENVRDSATGRTVLIPQGARLIGRYDSAVTYGQRRALLVWNRIVFPDGSSIDLDDMPATDSSGYSGLQDRVDSHTWMLLKGIVLSTLLGVGTQLSLGGESGLVRAIRESTQQNASDAGNRITSRNLDVQPTIVVRPGWPVRAIVDKDLVLKPWRG